MEKQLLKLRDQRINHQTQVTSLANQISIAIQRRKPIGVLDGLLENLEQEFTQLSCASAIYNELLNSDSDSKFESFKVTSGKSVTDFLANVKQIYDSAIQTVLAYEQSLIAKDAEQIKRDINVLLERSNFMVKQLDDIGSDDSVCHSRAAVVFQEIDVFITKLRDNVHSLGSCNVEDYSGIFSKVTESIINLEHNVMISKQMPHLLVARPQQAVTPQNDDTQNPDLENSTSSHTHSATLSSQSPVHVNSIATGISLSGDSPATQNSIQSVTSAGTHHHLSVNNMVSQAVTSSIGMPATTIDQVSQAAGSIDMATATVNQVRPAIDNSGFIAPISISNITAHSGGPSVSSEYIDRRSEQGRLMESLSNRSPLVSSQLASIPESYPVTHLRQPSVQAPAAIQSNRHLTSTPLNFGNPQPRYDAQQQLSLSITAAYEDVGNQNFVHGQGQVGLNGRNMTNSLGGRGNHSRFKKAPLPTFNGERREWPEFRAVWLSYAYSEVDSEEERAWNLKQSLKGDALSHVKAILVNQPLAHERMWKRLEGLYSDASVAVRTAFIELERLKLVAEGDIKGLVEFVNTVEMCYSQLGEVKQLSSVTPAQVDMIKAKLPPIIKREWMRVFNSLSTTQKIHPFTSLMKFLEEERNMCIREMTEEQPKPPKQFKERFEKPVQTAVRSHASTMEQAAPKSSNDKSPSPCLIHKHPKTKHVTMDCNEFKKLSKSDRVGLLMRNRVCFKCSGAHRREDCPTNSKCTTCQGNDHHALICKKETQSQLSDIESTPSPQTSVKTTVEKATSHTKQDSSYSVFPIQVVAVAGTSTKAIVFADGGSNATYVATNFAKKLKAKKVGTTLLRITRVGNTVAEHRTNIYRLKLITTKGEVVPVMAYGMEEITSPVSSLNMKVLKSLFPCRGDLADLVREEGQVDILLGNDYYGYHPKVEVDKAGTHLSLMEGAFGRCLQGSHPTLQQRPITSNLIGSSCFENEETNSPVPVLTCITRADINAVNKFIQCEEMVSEVQPRCGSCKCGKCPIRGHTYSFREQQELEIIQNNLQYDKERQAWITTYPWISDPKLLPDNYKAVLATLRNTEKTLLKRGEAWTKIYSDQIADMEERGAARRLSSDELQSWRGPKFYISHLAVENAKSASTPVRIVFNSSQKFGGQSLNDSLAKGPDSYMTSLLGIILRWREGSSVLIGDIKKMFNSIYIAEAEQHCHRFLWRGMESDREPDTYVITRVNMGDRPAPSISTEAILKTASMMKDEYPRVDKLFRESMYVDDIVESVDSDGEAKLLANDATTVLEMGGFRIKSWAFNDTNTTETESRQVLGIRWNPKTDKIQFQPLLNFSEKNRGKHVDAGILPEQVPQAIPSALSKRVVLRQVMRLYDPLGLLSPFIVTGKLYLRETWDLGIAWDEPLPDIMTKKWNEFFCQMAELSSLEFDRCLTPEKAQGKPSLIILSDASDKAYGFAAYIRWKLLDGTYFCRLILAKSRIAPIRKLSTPQLELNGAVLGKRGRELIEKELRFDFEKVLHLTDSETVLCMLSKTSTRFKLYEGVRIGEIQAASNINEWRWVNGAYNTADWVTRGRRPSDIGPDTKWWNGPDFIHLDEELWDTKTVDEVGQKGPLPGEKNPVSTHHTMMVEVPRLGIDYDKYGSSKKLIWVIARLLAIAEGKSFKAGRTSNITVKHIQASKQILIKDVQSTMRTELEKASQGRYARLKPIRDAEGIWVIGERMMECNPLTKTQEDPSPKLLPSNHRLARLFMEHAHTAGGHRGRDATLARFRHEYWVPQGTSLAKSVKNNCRMCRIRDPKLLTQQMGHYPLSRLEQNAGPFSSTALDLFGPYQIRGEVQKRTTGKAWGVIFTDLLSRAVHIEPVFGYDTSSFLMALRRFTNVRGWPKTIYSDPGSQLTYAEKELRRIWLNIEREAIYKSSTDKGLTWVFGPADAPWYQGTAEALIKSTKRCLKFCMNGQRLSASEFLTVCTEAANIMNERPLGQMPSEDSTINLLTPNCLLLGRSLANSMGHTASSVDSVNTRAELVSQVCDRFWKHWMELFAPTMVAQAKWRKTKRNAEVGDIVLVSDSNALRSEYHLAEVVKTYPDKRGLVRRADVRYRNHRVGKEVKTYVGGSDVTVSRSVHKLALVVPIQQR